MRNKIILVISVGFLVVILLVSNLFEKKVYEVPEEQIETQITSETTTTSTTSTTTTKTTKKAIKTTRKTTKVSSVKNVATGSKTEYINYAREIGGYNDTQMQCLDYLWSHESNWNPTLVNKSSGACGIPQALPCSKIQNQQGSNDWKAQIRWGINYINYRYKNPCSAWNHFKNKKWY